MPEYYQIRVGGHLDREWSAWFDGLTLTHDPDGCTTLAGQVADQAALYGLIGKARDLGLRLILVALVAPDEGRREEPMRARRPTHRIAVSDGELSAYVAGSGPALVFLHGNAGRWQHWGLQLHALSRNYRCIAFDFRGYGASSPLRTPNSLSMMADDTHTLCQALGVTRATVVGHSMGGGVAQALALRHPHLVAGLVLLSPQAVDVVPARPPELTRAMLRPLLMEGFSPGFRQRQPGLVARLVAEQLETRLETLRNVTFDDLPMDPTAIRAPALVLAGGSDARTPAGETRRLAVQLPNGVYLELPAAGHNLPSEASAAVSTAIEQFVRDATVSESAPGAQRGGTLM